MKLTIIKIALAFLITCIISLPCFAEDSVPMISSYKVIFTPCFDQVGELRIAIRWYLRNGVPYYVVVNPYTLTTSLEPVANFRSRKTLDLTVPGYFTKGDIESTPYYKALLQYTAPPYLLQNAGLTHAANFADGEFLTVDMCPSVKPFEKDFFQALVIKAENEHQAEPVAIEMTGLWMIGHADEFAWLMQQQADNKLQITWINHSYSHLYFGDEADLSQNFLLWQFSHFKSEVLITEQLLVQKELAPAVFFRFPGLVADEKLILKCREFGLIPLGADAWLAKGQNPVLGSIILVHGNSNEHKGIEIALPLIPSLHLLPLPQAAL